MALNAISFLVIIVLEALSWEFLTDCLIIEAALCRWLSSLRNCFWKSGIENKGLCVNTGNARHKSGTTGEVWKESLCCLFCRNGLSVLQERGEMQTSAVAAC